MSLRRYHPAALPGAILTLCIIAFVLASLAYTMLPWSRERFELWPRHYVLLVQSDVAGDEVLGSLREAGVDHALSAWSSTVGFHAFDRMERVTVAEIPTRFSDLDPRLDPYMRRLPGLFRAHGTAGDYAVFYLPADTGILTTHLRVRSALAGTPGRWRLAGWEWLDAAVASVLLAAAALVLVAVSRRYRGWLATAAVPWLFVVLGDGLAALAPAVMLLLLWCYLFEAAAPAAEELLRYGRTTAEPAELVQRAVTLAVGVLAAVVLYGLRSGSQALWLALIAECWLAGAFVSRVLLRKRMQEHRVFMPASIMRRNLFRRRTGRTAYVPLVPWLLPVLVAVPLVYGTLTDHEQLQVAQPEPVPGVGDYSYTSIERLWERTERSGSAESGGLPTVADYVAHRAYQDAFMYDRRYGLPAPGDEVAVSRFTREGERLVKRREVVMRFDATWYDALLEEAVPGSIAGLLTSPRRATGVVRRPPGQLYWQPLYRVRQVVLVLIVLVPLYVLHAPVPLSAAAGTGYDTVRRKRQIA